VIGVTRCADFSGSPSELQEYVDGHLAGKHSDKTLGFHTNYGAEIVRLVPDFRPEDSQNGGTGVLIHYPIKDWVATSSSSKSSKSPKAEASARPAIEIVKDIMSDLGYSLSENDLSQGFFMLGIDSLEMVRMRNHLGAAVGRELPATLLLDFPSVQDVADELDRMRGFSNETSKLVEKNEVETANEGGDQPAEPGWASVDLEQLKQLQEKLKKLYALPQNQKKLGEQAAKHLPDKGKYLAAIEPILLEVEGPVLFSFGLADDMKPATVAKARKGFAPTVKRLGRRNPEVTARDTELSKLLKLTE